MRLRHFYWVIFFEEIVVGCGSFGDAVADCTAVGSGVGSRAGAPASFFTRMVTRRLVGSKGYHAETFLEGPYPVE